MVKFKLQKNYKLGIIKISGESLRKQLDVTSRFLNWAIPDLYFLYFGLFNAVDCK